MSSVGRYYRTLFRVCAQNSDLLTGVRLHAAMVTMGLLSSPSSYIQNAILHMYASNGRSLCARKVFDEIPNSHKDTVDWTTLMGCYASTGIPTDALLLFKQMQKQGVPPDDVTFVSVFNSCARLCNGVFGIQAHVCIIKTGFSLSVKACNAAMDMYVKCSQLSEAKKIFDDMKDRTVVSWTVLLEGVIRCEGVDNGRLVFDKMPDRNEIAWTIMIAGYIEHGFSHQAFALLCKMMSDSRYLLNHVTICSMLSACTQSGDLTMGRWLHVYSLKTLYNDTNIMVGTSLINMYAKCGQIDTAYKVFERMPNKNVVAWNSMLSGLAMHGRGTDVLNIFPRMVEEGIKPDEITFTAVLSSCSHSRLLDQGRKYFYSLKSTYGITPSIEHYSCMVDLLGRAGELDEAETLIRSMPIAPNEVVLGSLIGSCSIHNRLDLGERFLQELIETYPLNTECHTLLSNLYALAGKQERVISLRKILKERGDKKVPGTSCIYFGSRIHRFSRSDETYK